MKTAKKVRWDPIIARLTNNQVQQKNYEQESSADKHSRAKANWVAATQKRQSNKEFQDFLHDLFDRDGPTVKYQNPDSWRVYPIKKKSNADS